MRSAYDIVSEGWWKDEFRHILCDLYRKVNVAGNRDEFVYCHISTRAIDKLTLKEHDLIKTGDMGKVALTKIGYNLASHFMS